MTAYEIQDSNGTTIASRPDYESAKVLRSKLIADGIIQAAKIVAV